MWKLTLPVAVAFALLLSGGRPAAAKGDDYSIIVGGGGIAPYYYAIPGPLPLPGQWIGLLPNEGDQPSGRIPDPPDAAALLSGSYDLYFDDLPDTGAPHASYVPASSSHSAYLYWRGDRGGMPYVAWFTLTDAAHAYLDRAIGDAVAAKTAGGRDLETDWLASAVLHGRCCMRADGSPEFVSDTYIVTENIRHASMAVSGDDARRLLEGFIATLHNWHPTDEYRGAPFDGPARYEYFVTTVEGRDVFSFVATASGSITRVDAVEGFGGYFDAAPELNSLVARVIAPHLPASDAPTPSASSNNEASGIVWIVAGALAACLLIALGIGAARWHRPDRAVTG